MYNAESRITYEIAIYCRDKRYSLLAVEDRALVSKAYNGNSFGWGTVVDWFLAPIKLAGNSTNRA